MFFIPGWLISALTFPGVILHEWAHKFFCERLGVKVFEVQYFQFGTKVAGYVRHEIPTTYKQIFWISVGPLLVNSLTAILISFIALQTVSGGWIWYTLGWLSISVGMHSFPSDHDMSHVSSASKLAIKDGGSFLYYLAFPFVWLIWIANKLRIFWFDAIWAIILISIGGGFGSFHDITTTNQDKLLSQINICKSEASTLENQITTDQDQIDYIDNVMTRDKNENNIDEYNELVDPRNMLLSKIDSETSDYHTKVQYCNNLVDQYNSNI